VVRQIGWPQTDRSRFGAALRVPAITPARKYLNIITVMIQVCAALPLLERTAMADRRRDKRFTLTEPADGLVRVFPDALVQPSGEDEWIAISREAAVTGETLFLNIVTADADEGELSHRLPVCVIDSRPVIVEGVMRHRLRLCGGELAFVSFDQHVRRG
jgi:hypothetical protein